jgi:hypothetical protein
MSLLSDMDPLSVKDVRMGGKVVWTRIQYLVDGIRQLPDGERLEVLSHFCKGCGDYDPKRQCYCMADD